MALKAQEKDDLQAFRSFEESIMEIDEDEFLAARNDPRIQAFEEEAVQFFLKMECENRNLF